MKRKEHAPVRMSAARRKYPLGFWKSTHYGEGVNQKVTNNGSGSRCRGAHGQPQAGVKFQRVAAAYEARAAPRCLKLPRGIAPPVRPEPTLVLWSCLFVDSRTASRMKLDDGEGWARARRRNHGNRSTRVTSGARRIHVVKITELRILGSGIRGSPFVRRGVHAFGTSVGLGRTPEFPDPHEPAREVLSDEKKRLEHDRLLSPRLRLSGPRLPGPPRPVFESSVWKSGPSPWEI